MYYSLYSLREVRGSIIIQRALLKYGYSNFTLDILEYCELDVLIEREEYYINILKPEYNI
jgi:group I intron endonuclease